MTPRPEDGTKVFITYHLSEGEPSELDIAYYEKKTDSLVVEVNGNVHRQSFKEFQKNIWIDLKYSNTNTTWKNVSGNNQR